MCVPTSVDESRHIDEYEETEMNIDLVMRSEINYRNARVTETMRRRRKVNRVRRPRTPAERVA
jgi:hypothetical protein